MFFRMFNSNPAMSCEIPGLSGLFSCTANFLARCASPQRSGSPPPLTAPQIRILEDDAATVHLLRTILDTGVAAVAIHPRLPNDRTEKVPADYARLKRILAGAWPPTPPAS